VHSQDAGFTRHRVWDFKATSEEDYPLFLHAPYFDIYRSQVTKQADLVAALFARGDRFTAEEKARDFAYYEAICVRDSSLSAALQAIVAAEVGHLDLAYDYFGEAARVDLDDLAHNTKDGLHIASLAGSWLVAVCAFGGMRDHDGALTFSPRLPGAFSRLAFTIGHRGRRLRVEVTPGRARYEVSGEGEPLVLSHEGEELSIAPGSAEERDWTVADPGAVPTQPHGRAPRRRTPT
jgi:alpha,alpha-trehalose phosphorylase